MVSLEEGGVLWERTARSDEGPHLGAILSTLGRPFRRLAAVLGGAIRWVSASSRRRRTAFYATVVGIIAAANSGFVSFVLELLQIKPSTANRWELTLREDTLSFVALLVAGFYLDTVVRRDESERSQAARAELQSIIKEEVVAASQRAIVDLRDEVRGELTGATALIGESLDSWTADRMGPLIERALSDPFALADPKACLRAGLFRTLETHQECLPGLVDGIVGQDESVIVDDASIRFELRSSEDNYFEVSYTYKGKFRRPTYSYALVQAPFNAETKILSGGITDAWLLVDQFAYSRSLELSSRNFIELRYRDQSGTWVTERRSFSPADRQAEIDGLDATTFTVSLNPPGDFPSVETTIHLTICLPSRPVGLRWLFDTPTYVEEIVFDVEHLWPDWEVDFALYPFLLGTEDYTQRSAHRQDTYRIGIRSWLHRGHGVILMWERLGRLDTRERS